MNEHIESQINLETAKRFLSRIDDTDFFTFQTFDDNKTRKNPQLVRILNGTFEEHRSELVRLNLQGAGIFFTVNSTDGKGRRAENIKRVRALFVDLDGSPLEPILHSPLEPHLIVQSSEGRYHVYWLVEGVLLDEFPVIQKNLSQKFKADPAVIDLPRVMRLPGFYHHKESPILSKVIFDNIRQSYSKDHLLKALEINLFCRKEENKTVSDNPVIAALSRLKLLIKQEEYPTPCWIIKCPWSHLHTTSDSGTKYFEPHPSNGLQGGFQCFHSHCIDRGIQDLKDFLGVLPTSFSQPLPLHRPLKNPGVFPIEALGKVLGPAAKTLQRVIQAPDSVCAQSVLGAAALACQPYANISIDSREIPLSIFLLTVAESGDRKSGTDKAALKPIYAWQKMLFDSFKEEHKQYTRCRDLWECKKKEWMKDPSKGIYKEDPPQEPLHPLILVEEPTYEGIVKYLAIGQPSIGLFSDEGARFFGGHAMGRDNQLKTIAGLSSLWDGKEISRLRGGDGNMLLYGRRVSLHLMIQEVILEQLMSNKMMECQGFLPRCLISFPESTAGKRQYVEEDLDKDLAITKYYAQLNLLLDKKLPVEPYPAPQNELKPIKLNLTATAKKEWISYHNAIDKDLGVGKRLEQIRRFANKAAEHVLRLAGNLGMIDRIEMDQIELEDVQRGIALVEYYLNELMRIQGYLTVPTDLILAQKLLNWFGSKGRDAFSLQEIYQYGPTQIRQATAARSIMKILETHGWAKPVNELEVEGKRYKEGWMIRHLSS